MRRSNCFDRTDERERGGGRGKRVKQSTERKENDKTKCERISPEVSGGYRLYNGVENRAEIELTLEKFHGDGISSGAQC